jgi:hypothetical protein
MTNGLDVVRAEELASALRQGGSALHSVPPLLRHVLESEVWRDYTTTRGDHVRHNTWESFVTTLPLKGLGSTPDVIRRLVGGDTDLLDMIDEATTQPPGRPKRSETLDNIKGSRYPSGTSRENALRRLRTQRPDLHAEVIAGRMTCHAAAVAAGFRPPTFTIRADDAAAAARAIRRHMAPEVVLELLEGLLLE